MTSRPSRSASIPIPARTSSSSQSRNLESMMSIPFLAPSRPRVSSSSNYNFGTGGHGHSPSGFGHIPDDHHAVGTSFGARPSSSSAIATSPVRSTARSLTSSSGARERASTFEPRIIRADASSEAPCQPSTSMSPTRTRRTSTTGVRATSAQRHSSSVLLAPLFSPSTFTRPAYLEHSALRHLLHTEAPPLSPLGRKPDNTSQANLLETPSSPMDSDEESNVSPPRELSGAPLPHLPLSNPTLSLPTRWSDQIRHAMLTVSPDGRDLSFQGASCGGEKDAAAARADHHAPSACGIYYYEVEIISKGQKGHISIGFAGRDVKLSRLPGWEKNSWGYHGDDGYAFASESHGQTFGPTFGTGDIIGCGIDFTTNKAFYTKDGNFLGSVFENVGVDIDLFPSVGMRHSGEHIRVNFGQEPFRFDIEYHVSQQRNTVWGSIIATPLRPSLLRSHSRDVKDERTVDDEISPAEEHIRKPINRLVLSYLAHHGYARTARTFLRHLDNVSDATTPTPSADVDINMDMDGSSRHASFVDSLEHDIEQRTRIVNSVIEGDIDLAFSETREHYPSALDQEDGLVLFKLKCRKFIELVLEATELKKRLNKRPVMVDLADDDGVMVMDIDGEEQSPSPLPPDTNGFASGNGSPLRRDNSASPARRDWRSPSTIAQCEAALTKAISYGQALTNEYKAKGRSDVEALLKQTFSIVAFNDPLEEGCPAADIAGQEARVALANELNQAILSKFQTQSILVATEILTPTESQGQPSRPGLETLYRHAAVCITQLGLLGVGSAVFADLQKELLDR
ncbi:hypothetical protein HGRIS_007287 [Hohenbuehelia grisea]|uniref:SPRY-domain-containing protein n=1 Tax=Hohenbuehelia grisea TaxID=104357 RepID=A0ABR3J4U3_9AGAR